MSAGPSIPTDPRPTSGIRGDVSCLNCGYNLRGLSPDARCPECGVDIRHTLLAPFSSTDGVRWARRLLTGLNLQLLAIVMALADLLLLYFHDQGSRLLNNAVLGGFVSFVMPLASATLTAVGAWLLTASAPDQPYSISGVHWTIRGTSLICVASLAWLFVPEWIHTSRDFRDTARTCAPPLFLISATIFSCVLPYGLHQIAYSLRHPTLISSSATVARYQLISVAGLVAPAIVLILWVAWDGSAIPSPIRDGLLVAFVIFAIINVVTTILVIIVMLSIRSELRQSLRTPKPLPFDH